MVEILLCCRAVRSRCNLILVRSSIDRDFAAPLPPSEASKFATAAGSFLITRGCSMTALQSTIAVRPAASPLPRACRSPAHVPRLRRSEFLLSHIVCIIRIGVSVERSKRGSRWTCLVDRACHAQHALHELGSAFMRLLLRPGSHINQKVSEGV